MKAKLLGLLEPVHDFDARPVVEHLLTLAQEAGASDLHLRPSLDKVEILMRLDGVLQWRFDLPSEPYPRLLVGLKNAARLASYKKAIPQDGRLTHKGTDMRVATTPTHFGEKVVVRLVAGAGKLPVISDLGFSSKELQLLKTMVCQPQGLLLATGPAGSGKTTTLLSLLSWLVDSHKQRYGAALNVVTLEDPIESILPVLTQTSLAPELGMTFASGLKSLLRQDPEVILVGEIRDSETAAAVTSCSLTGHLVCSTLHTRDAVGVIPRMLEMGVAPYQLAAGLVGVISQRLLRKLCLSCREPCSAPTELSKEAERAEIGLQAIFRAKGCGDCLGTGFKGRTALPEILPLDDTLRQGILDRTSLRALVEHGRSLGMISLRQAGLARVAEGVTSYEELDRVLPISW